MQSARMMSFSAPRKKKQAPFGRGGFKMAIAFTGALSAAVFADPLGNTSAEAQKVSSGSTAAESQAISIGDPIESSAIEGRVTTLTIDEDDIASIEVLSKGEHGNVTVNPDNTLALVLTQSGSDADISFDIRVTYTNGDIEDRTVNVDVTEGVQDEVPMIHRITADKCGK